GLDFFQERATNNSTGYIAYDAIDINDPNPAVISKAAVDTMLASSPVTSSESQQQVYSAYISDVIEVIPQLTAMASLRLDHFVNDGSLATQDDDYNQTTLSPKFGLVFQPIPERLSLFANYMNGFNNVAPVQQGDGTIETFDPEQANQWEAGVKANFFNGRLTATASYYDITVSDIIRQDPNRPNFVIQDGENYSRGMEFSVMASPAPGLNIIAGYSHNNSEVTKTDNDNIRGRRPERAGPEDLINGWISYRISSGNLEGLGIGFGGNYASENYTINRASTGRFKLPSYTILNGSLFYETASYRLDLKINNLADKEYYNGWSTVNPQAPRNVTASFSYRF
ncbi:MAG: TonB-dependent receptor, partial [Balneolaceae bacterium]|nr:TonB-dependent receptor [Balneolaceae bacterium]